MSQKIINGDSATVLKQFAANTIDAVVTDPPYGIEFLGKDWDSNTGAIDIWRECLRVLKPGGHLLAFSAARTYHHLATRIESVGFEIRDQIMWLYASGFPKAQDIGKGIDRRQGKTKTMMNEHIYFPDNDQPYVASAGQNKAPRCKICHSSTGPIHKKCERANCPRPWETPCGNKWAGWKTALKPAHEPIVMARKPFKGSTIDNVLEHGVGALNIDATRIAAEPFEYCADGIQRTTYAQSEPAKWNDSDKQMIRNDKGRFPSNVLGEVAGYQKFFYCPKVSRKERHRGFEQKHIPTSKGGMLDKPTDGSEWVLSQHRDERARTQANIGNNHPTVKPVDLMKYLVKLVTPQGAHVVDPFCGSGSTGMACKELGRQFTGVDLDTNYCAIAERRIAATKELKAETLFE